MTSLVMMMMMMMMISGSGNMLLNFVKLKGQNFNNVLETIKAFMPCELAYVIYGCVELSNDDDMVLKFLLVLPNYRTGLHDHPEVGILPKHIFGFG